MTAPAELDLSTAPGSPVAKAEPAPADPPGSGEDPDRQRPGLDALLEDFALRLEADGLVIERSVPVGATSFDEDSVVPPIDIAVRDEDSGRRLAVESDGPSYAALGSVRERDRMRAERLARLGWDHLRVWSIDIFRDPARGMSLPFARNLPVPIPRSEEHTSELQSLV